jgi:hypothetical protein
MRILLHQRRGILSVFIFVLLLPALRAPCAAQDTSIKEVEGYGEAEVSEDLTLGQAKAAALNRALVNALEAVGVNVDSKSVVFNGDLVSDLVRSTSRGVIVSRKIIEDHPEVRDKRITYKVRVKASVKPLNLERRGNFKVEASVSRVDKPPGSSGSQVFQHDDEIQVRVKTNKDAYLHIFGVDQNLNITRFYPNEYVKDEIVPSGKDFVFPSGTLRERGIRLRVKAPKVAQKATESVLVVATTEKISLLSSGSGETPTVTDLMRELSEIYQGMWIDKTVGYEVRR